MTLTVHHTGVSVLSEPNEGDQLSVHHAGISVLLEPNPPATVPKIHHVAAQVLIRADVNSDNEYVHPAHIYASEDDMTIYTDLTFPECIAYGSSGSPIYLTDKVEVLSGAEQRNSRSTYPRHEYSINMENLPADEVAQVMDLWHTCSGDFAAFLFLDPMDHTSARTETVFSGSTVAATDQVVATADGSTQAYPLYKTYEKGARAKTRRIRYPKLDTLVVAVDGQEVTNWSYSYDEQMVRFFLNVTNLQITGTKVDGIITGGDFSDLMPGEMVYVEGFSTSGYNRPGGGGEPLIVVSADGSSATFTNYDGSTYSGSEAGADLTFYSALPPAGADITAGFYFYTPVRFEDGDNAESEIRNGMRESVIADFDNITLREVFE